jgi:universal stress protein E
MRESTILVIIDTTAGAHQPALERGAWLAKQAGARLELFACEYDPDAEPGHVTTVWTPEASLREQLLAHRRRALEELAAPLRKQGLTVTVDAVWDHPFESACCSARC